jgi:multimeric flavodoxin WrbA
MVSILGISGSPVHDSNTDRVVKAVLGASGLDSEFVKLSSISVGPCRACKACVDDNVCKVRDDFPALAERVKSADALVIGGYTPYGMLDAFTKAFLERLWSMRHVNNLNRNKLVVTVVTGLTVRGVDLASEMIAQEMRMERMEVMGQIKVNGNVPCLTCGHGDACEMSAVRILYGKEARASVDHCVRAEDQRKVWEAALRLGQLVGDRARAGSPGSSVPLKRRFPVWRIPSMIAVMARTRLWTAAARKHRAQSAQQR